MGRPSEFHPSIAMRRAVLNPARLPMAGRGEIYRKVVGVESSVPHILLKGRNLVGVSKRFRKRFTDAKDRVENGDVSIGGGVLRAGSFEA